MEITIRNYRPSDRVDLCRCLVSLGDYAVRLDPWHRLTRTPDYGRRLVPFALSQVRAKHGFVLVAETDSEPAGIAIAWTLIPTGPDRTAELPTKVGYVWGLVVLPPWRGRGIGTRLLRECERRFRAAGCDQLNIPAFVPNRRALGLYEREGFEPRFVRLGKRLGRARARWPQAPRKKRRLGVRQRR